MTKPLFGAAADNPTSDILLALVERFGEIDSTGNRRAFVGAYRRPEQCDPNYCIIRLVDGKVERDTILASERDLGYITAQSPSDLPRADYTVQLTWGEVQRFKDGERLASWPTLDAYLADPDGLLQRKKDEPYDATRRIVTMNMLETALDGDIVGEWFRTASPTHGREDRSLAIKPSRRSQYGVVVVPHSASDSKMECLRYVLDALAGVEQEELDDEDEYEDDEAPAPKRSTLSFARQFWDEAEHEDTSLVGTYLTGRAIPEDAFKPALGTTIREHPGIRHKGLDRVLPAMLCRVELPGASDMIALHITFLEPDGSARVDRRVLGSPKGGVVKLQAFTSGTLMLAEGIESALSDIVMRRTAPKLMNATSWSVLNAGNMAELDLPANARSIKIVSDGDKAARVAISKAVARYQLREKRNVGVVEFGDGVDANDRLRGGKR